MFFRGEGTTWEQLTLGIRSFKAVYWLQGHRTSAPGVFARLLFPTHTPSRYSDAAVPTFAAATRDPTGS